MTNLRSNTRASLLWSGGAKLVSQGATFLTTILLAGMLPVSDFGLVALALVTIGFIQVFIDAGFLHALIQRPALSQREMSSCFWLLLAAGVTACVVSWWARDLVDRLYGVSGIGAIVAVQSTLFLFLPFRIISQAVFSRHIRIDELSRWEALLSPLRLVASWLLAYGGAGVWSLVLPQIVTEMLFSLICYWRAGWRLTPELDVRALGPLLSFGVDISLSRVVWFAASRVDQVLVGRILGTEALGMYGLALQWAGAVPQFVSATLNRVAFPLFARLQDDQQRLKEVYLTLSMYLAGASLPILAGIALVAPDLFALSLPPVWRGALTATGLLCVLSSCKLMETLAGLLLNARGRSRQNLLFNVAALGCSSLGVLAGARWGGLDGAALGAMIAFVPVASLVINFSLKECGGSLVEWWNGLRAPLVAAIAMGGAVFCYGAAAEGVAPLYRLSGMVVTGVLVYGGTLYLLAPSLLMKLRHDLTGLPLATLSGKR